MNILVTGAAGFIGSHLCEELLKQNYKVVGVDDLSSGTIENLIESVKNSKFSFFRNNFSNKDFCKEICKNIDIIFHLAAFVSVPNSISFPSQTTDINILQMVNLLDAAVQNKVDKFIFSSSAAVYGNTNDLIKTENSEIQLLSPYAVTKYTGELYCKMYYEIFNLKTICLRYFNVFGPRQNINNNYAAAIPKFIYQINNNECPIIFGDGKQTRDFIYVSNVVDANIKSINLSSSFGEVFNIASGKSIPIDYLIDLICKIINKKVKPIFKEERKGDVKYSYACIEKAKGVLNYIPIVSFEDGLKKTIKE